MTNTPTKHRWLLCLALAVAVCASGCVVIPTPEFNSGSARANIHKETPLQFELGKTTRADVISALGEPDAVSPDEHMLAYRSEKIRGIWFVGSSYSGAAGAITKDLYLVAEFDAHGILQKLERSSHWLTSSDPYKMLSVATETGVVTATNVNLTVRLQKPAYWLKGVDGFKPRGATQMIGWPGQLLLTDTDLQFIADVAKGQFANTVSTGPALILPFDAISEVSVDKFVCGRRLVVRTRAGEVHSFSIGKGIFQDKEAHQSIAEFLQSKIKH
jgi:hypothetical protein